jgi:hypothetical protein
MLVSLCFLFTLTLVATALKTKDDGREDVPEIEENIEELDTLEVLAEVEADDNHNVIEGEVGAETNNEIDTFIDEALAKPLYELEKLQEEINEEEGDAVVNVVARNIQSKEKGAGEYGGPRWSGLRI